MPRVEDAVTRYTEVLHQEFDLLLITHSCIDLEQRLAASKTLGVGNYFSPNHLGYLYGRYADPSTSRVNQDRLET